MDAPVLSDNGRSRGSAMNKKRLLVLYAAINIGLLAVSVLMYFSGRPITLVLLIALFSAIVLNGFVWAAARSYRRSNGTGGLAATIVGGDVQQTRRRFRLYGLAMIAIGMCLCLLGVWTGRDDGQLDITSLCIGGVLLAQGIFLLVFSSRGREKDRAR